MSINGTSPYLRCAGSLQVAPSSKRNQVFLGAIGLALLAWSTVLSSPSMAEGLNTGFNDQYWRRTRAAKGAPPAEEASSQASSPAQPAQATQPSDSAQRPTAAQPAVTSSSPETCTAMREELAEARCVYVRSCQSAMGQCTQAQLACRTQACVAAARASSRGANDRRTAGANAGNTCGGPGQPTCAVAPPPAGNNLARPVSDSGRVPVAVPVGQQQGTVVAVPAATSSNNGAAVVATPVGQQGGTVYVQPAAQQGGTVYVQPAAQQQGQVAAASAVGVVAAASSSPAEQRCFWRSLWNSRVCLITLPGTSSGCPGNFSTMTKNGTTVCTRVLERGTTLYHPNAPQGCNNLGTIYDWACGNAP